MKATFYRNISDNRYIDKEIVQLTDPIDIIPKDALSIIEPVIVIKYSEKIKESNYFYVDELNRYYYIKDWVLLTGNQMSITGAVDVLMSFKDDILNSTAFVSRNENIGLSDIVDDKIPLFNRKELKVIEFEGTSFNSDIADFDSLNFVLNVSGGGTIGN